eukprot:gb/GEZN01000584.1/.p1 GENE.gb/GEZN01000584.1/~~gb/GEZN01000584.1/.p1  ORF type:complete len:1265 (-),score=359.76 gb/GEZN01000584.1/:281-3889(-)
MVLCELTYVDDTAENVMCFTSQDDFKEGIPMSLIDGTDDQWAVAAYFPPGRLLYRFLVDKEWMCDENREVITVRGDSYNEIEIEGDDDDEGGDTSKAKKRAKRKKWRAKKKMLKARRRALQNLQDEKADPREQAERLAAALKQFESSQASKLEQFTVQAAQEKEALLKAFKNERDDWVNKFAFAQQQEQNAKLLLARAIKEMDEMKDQKAAAFLHARQSVDSKKAAEDALAARETDIKGLEEDKLQLKEQVRDLKRKMKSWKSEVKAKCQKAVDEVTEKSQEEIRLVNMDNDERKREVEKLLYQKQSAEEIAMKSESQAAELRQERDELKHALEEAELQQDKLTQANDEKSNTLNSLQKELLAANQSLDEAKQELASKADISSQQLTNLQARQKELSSEVLAVKAELAEAKKELQTAKQEKFEVQTELTKVTARLEAAESDVQEKGKALAMTEADKMAAMATRSKKEAELQTFTKRMEEVKMEREELVLKHSQEIKAMSEKLALSENTFKIEREKASASAAELSRMKEQANSLSTKLTAATQQHDNEQKELAAKIQELEKDLEKHKSLGRKLIKDKATVQKAKEDEAKIMAEEKKKILGELEDINQKFDAEYKKANEQKTELDGLTLKHKNLVGELTTLTVRFDEVVKEKEQQAEEEKKATQELKQTLSQEQEKASELKKNVGSLQDELEKQRLESKAALVSLEKDNDAMKKKVTETETMQEQLKEKIRVVSEKAKVFSKQASMFKVLQVEVNSQTIKQIGLLETTIIPPIQEHAMLLEETLKKYKKELTERRKYFNLVQELRGNIRVCLRVRPILKSDLSRGATAAEMGVTFPDTDAIAIKKTGWEKKEYEFDRVYPTTSTQDEVYKDTSFLVRSTMDGYNVCIIAYGQTGSGKTHTMTGTDEDPGVNSRALKDLFVLRKKRSADYVYEISVSMMEIYNEELRDLLAPDKSDLKCQIRLGKQGVFVENLVEREVNSEQEVYKIMEEGAANRTVGKTDMNAHSSRSHSIVTINVQGHNFTAGITYMGKLHLIDLAGSERVGKSGATGDRLKEAQAINKSLSALGNVLQKLQMKSSHVPFRDSKLTYLLQDSLGGNSKCMMFINLSPGATDIDESFCSIEFASKVRRVELGQAGQNKVRAPAKDSKSNTTGDASSSTITRSARAGSKATPGPDAAPKSASKPGGTKTAVVTRPASKKAAVKKA